MKKIFLHHIFLAKKIFFHKHFFIKDISKHKKHFFFDHPLSKTLELKNRGKNKNAEAHFNNPCSYKMKSVCKDI